VDEKLRNTLLSLGTYLFGRCATIQEARELGELLWRNDPFRVQQYHKTWGKFDPPLYDYRSPYRFDLEEYYRNLTLHPNYPYYVLDTEPEYMNIENQCEEAANRLMELGLFDFFLHPSLREGEVSNEVYKVNLAGVVQDTITGELSFSNSNQDVVAQIRSLLEQTAGMPIKTLLAEQDALLERGHQSPAVAESAQAPPPLPTQRRYRVA
jgi:hypothetical protein